MQIPIMNLSIYLNYINDNIEVEDESMEEGTEEVFDFDAIPEISPPPNMQNYYF
nr:14376_t:CDS:2 [Entrophospora candida]